MPVTTLRHLRATLSAAALLLAACSPTTVYHRFRDVATEGWEHGDTVLFIIDSISSSDTYRFELDVRTTPQFPFQKLWLVVDRHFSAPELHRRDTVECVLATPEGNITGRGVSLYAYTFSLPPLPLTQGQHGHIAVSHIMRRDLLEGVSDIGIKILRQ